MSLVLIGLALLFFLGHGLNWFFIKTKVPDLLVLVVIGYVMGPILGVIQVEDLGKVGGVLSALALVVILYEGGLNLKAKDLVKSTLPAAGLTFLGFLLIVGSTILIVKTFAFQSWRVAALVGLGIGSTSSAVVIPMVKHLSIQENTKTILSLESAFTDVLAIVFFLVIVDAFASGKFEMVEVLNGLGPKTLLSVIWGILLGVVWAVVRKRFTAFTKMSFSSESWVLLAYGLIEYSGYNGAMGALALGFTLANLNLLPEWFMPYISHDSISVQEMELLSEITLLLKTFFFIYLGTLIQFANWKIVAIALIICLLIFVTRYLTVRLLFKPDKYQRLDAMITVAMGPRGLACAVLATIPMQRGIQGGEWIQSTLFAVIPISILMTALFVVLSEVKAIRKSLDKIFGAFREEPVPLVAPENPPPS